MSTDRFQSQFYQKSAGPWSGYRVVLLNYCYQHRLTLLPTLTLLLNLRVYVMFQHPGLLTVFDFQPQIWDDWLWSVPCNIVNFYNFQTFCNMSFVFSLYHFVWKYSRPHPDIDPVPRSIKVKLCTSDGLRRTSQIVYSHEFGMDVPTGKLNSKLMPIYLLFITMSL